jgi:hypothetical protein
VQSGAERGAAAAPNTSINHQGTEQQPQREISDVIAEQDQAAIYALEERQRFGMFATWAPSEKALADQLTIAGLSAESVTDELFADFKGFFVAKSATVDSPSGWCFRLVKWIKREQVKRAFGQSNPPDFDDSSWADDLGDL